MRDDLQGGEQYGGVNPENMIWIFCTARSGSTWLRSMLHELVEGGVWEEPKVGRLFGEFYSRAKQTQLGRVNYVLGDPTREAWTSALRNFVLHTAWASHPSITPERYLIVKEPGGAVGAPLLMDALPESRMVLLVRDPRDYTASWVDAHKEGGWRSGNEGPENSTERTAKVAQRYLHHVGEAKRAYDAHAGRKVLIRYEDLRADALGTMKRLYAELEIVVEEGELIRAVEKHSWENIPEEQKGEGKFYRKASPGSWREDLTPEQAKMVEHITAPLLSELYPA